MTDLIQRFEALVLENFLLRRNLNEAQAELRESNEVLGRIDLEDYEAYLSERSNPCGPAEFVTGMSVLEDEDA